MEMILTGRAGVPHAIDEHPLRAERSAIDRWLAQSLAASYVTAPGNVLLGELLALLPEE